MGFSDNDNTIVTYMKNAGRIEKHIFSMCFSYTGGALSIGGVDHSIHQGAVQYAPYNSKSSEYVTIPYIVL